MRNYYGNINPNKNMKKVDPTTIEAMKQRFMKKNGFNMNTNMKMNFAEMMVNARRNQMMRNKNMSVSHVFPMMGMNNNGMMGMNNNMNMNMNMNLQSPLSQMIPQLPRMTKTIPNTPYMSNGGPTPFETFLAEAKYLNQYNNMNNLNNMNRMASAGFYKKKRRRR